MTAREAFFTICADAKPAKGCYVSLYVSVPYYGGPEEGGWWGRDTALVAYQWFDTEESSEAAREAIREEAVRLNEQAKREFGEQCLREMEWLDARGLDADFLPEVDGEEEYWVTTEESPGASVSHGCRHYE